MPDAEGKLSAEEKTKAIAWIQQFGNRLLCPVCGDGQWSLSEHVTTPVIVSGNGALNLGGGSYPVISIYSNKCGYTMYISAIVAGILPPEVPQSG